MNKPITNKTTFLKLGGSYKEDIFKDRILQLAKLCCDDSNLTEDLLDCYRQCDEDFVKAALNGGFSSSMAMWHILLKGPCFKAEQSCREDFKKLPVIDKLSCCRACYLCIGDMPYLYYLHKFKTMAEVVSLVEGITDSVFLLAGNESINMAKIKSIVTGFVQHCITKVSLDKYCYTGNALDESDTTSRMLAETKTVANDFYEAITLGKVYDKDSIHHNHIKVLRKWSLPVSGELTQYLTEPASADSLTTEDKFSGEDETQAEQQSYSADKPGEESKLTVE